MVRRYAAVAVSIVLAGVTTLGQAGQVAGVVIDASGAAVPSALVEVDVGGNQAGQTQSAANGTFAVSGIPAGSIFVIAAGLAVIALLSLALARSPSRAATS